MDVTFNCGWCGQQIVVDEAGAGLATECPKCGQPITVPSQEPSRAELSATKECPFCAETIKREAIVCKHCGRDLVGKRLTEAVTEKVQGPAKSVVPTVGITIPERARYRVGLLVILAIALGLVGYIAYRAYQDSFEYMTEAHTLSEIRRSRGDLALLGLRLPETAAMTDEEELQKDFQEASSHIGLVTDQGWEVYKVTETPGGYTIVYRRKKQ
jgi:DNA-directed RNA polymerase subunit RPC12/RpoP